MSWFVALVQDSNASHSSPYACAGSENAKSSLCLCGLPMINTQIIMLVQAPDNSKNTLQRYRLPTIHMPILTLVKVGNNADNILHLCRLPTIHTPILMLVKVPDNSKIPYACTGF
ncbi:hypothetical protein O181_073673 [Austropuccinia psidii MF-1]|uniref:Uncharacterized protein n=1 Tax=Austropuccinia psidii MF-1 TaxID=1389203 RepID=A0A9Q3F5H9_9BASI|nr:hypothetical protein [Austropuccinia psidii MF-1]